ncbi:hypothetical protein ACHAPI_001739 [Fusarium lateritium]
MRKVSNDLERLLRKRFGDASAETQPSEEHAALYNKYKVGATFLPQEVEGLRELSKTYPFINIDFSFVITGSDNNRPDACKSIGKGESSKDSNLSSQVSATPDFSNARGIASSSSNDFAFNNARGIASSSSDDFAFNNARGIASSSSNDFAFNNARGIAFPSSNDLTVNTASIRFPNAPTTRLRDMPYSPVVSPTRISANYFHPEPQPQFQPRTPHNDILSDDWYLTGSWWGAYAEETTERNTEIPMSNKPKEQANNTTTVNTTANTTVNNTTTVNTGANKRKAYNDEESVSNKKACTNKARTLS